MDVTGVVVVNTFLLSVLQITYGSKNVSPLDTHPNTMLVAISSFLLYCFANACNLEHYITSNFCSSTWPALVVSYNNFRKFLGFFSIVSFASIVFSTSPTTLAIVHLLSALFFSGKSALSLIQNRYSFTMRRAKRYGYMQVRVDLPHMHAFARDFHALPCRDNRSIDLISMTEHGMVNVKSTVEVKFPFGRMSEILDVESGWGSHYATLEILPNLGMGEVKDGPKPESPKKVTLDEKTYNGLVHQASRISQLENDLKREHKAPAELGGGALPQKGIVINGAIENSGFPQHSQMATKGKSKMVGEKLFNNKGLWSQEAIAAVEKGKDMNKKLGKMVLNFEDKVMGNVSLADWLEIKQGNNSGSV